MRRHSKIIRYEIHGAAGVLVWGHFEDLLITICMANERKIICSQQLPHSTLRVKFFYPNRKRIPAADVAAARRALADPSVAAAVASRRAFALQSSTVRAPARAGGLCNASAEGGAVVLDVVFCQAGVVAPPDSLTGGTAAVDRVLGDAA